MTGIRRVRVGVFLLRQQSLPIGQRIEQQMQVKLFATWLNSDLSPKEQFARVFTSCDQWILVMATGIAVRFVADLLQDKYSDPAVIVLDEGCRFAVSLLGGHEAGGNDLAFKVASIFSAAPVVTTATEVLKPLVVGIGCKKNTPAAAIKNAVLNALGDRFLKEVRSVASIDLKKDEPGLLEFCNANNLPLQTFKQEDVAARPWVISPSAWVQEVAGVSGVCEPCALMASSRGRLIQSKKTLDGVAVAIVEDRWEALR